MNFTLWHIGKALNKYKKNLLGFTTAYVSSVLINLLTEAESISEIGSLCITFHRPAIFLMGGLIVLTLMVYLAAALITSVTRNQTPSVMFRKIMAQYTAPELKECGRNDLSWGYNKNIHRAKDPMGWLPSAFVVSSYVDNLEYLFPLQNPELPEYTRRQYSAFMATERAQACIAKGNNEKRFAVVQIEPNYGKMERKVSLRMLKTDWLSLQFSWNYMRLLDGQNNPIPSKMHLDAIRKAMSRVFVDANESNEYLINSFCLHLIIETKDGKAVLARISRNKNNDYPSTWAATLGEQVERSDFYDEIRNSMRSDFVECWTKRALREELRIDETIGDEGISELEEYVDMNSLRVLSVDFEADIYNIALTAVIRLRVDFQQFVDSKSVWIDREEATEFRVVDVAEIRNILLHYPTNSHEYHPSTYLRLLMFHLYNTGIRELCKAFCEDYRKLNISQ